MLVASQVLLLVGLALAFRAVTPHRTPLPGPSIGWLRKLHMGVADGGAHELEPALAQVLTHSIGLGCGRRNIAQFVKLIHHRPAVHKLPDISIEAAELVPYLQELLSIGDRGQDF